MRSLKSVMDKYGYLITNVMVTDVEPDSRVKQSMNEINAAKRMQDAAQYQADAMKIKVVKEAEADAESKYLAGTGIARQRKAIVDGLRQSIVSFSGEVADTTPREVIEMMLMTQYFDVLKCVLARATRARARAPRRERDQVLTVLVHPARDRALAWRLVRARLQGFGREERAGQHRLRQPLAWRRLGNGQRDPQLLHAGAGHEALDCQRPRARGPAQAPSAAGR